MRVLFRDKEDSTLFVAEVKDAMYYPDESCLSFVSADNDDIDIYDIPYSLAEPIIRELFEKGSVDLSSYKASLNGQSEEADEAPSPAPISSATQMRGPEVEKKLFRGVFGRKKD